MLLLSQVYHTGIDYLFEMPLCDYFEIMPDAVKAAEETRKRLTRR
jgi:hypothetical protein